MKLARRGHRDIVLAVLVVALAASVVYTTDSGKRARLSPQNHEPPP